MSSRVLSCLPNTGAYSNHCPGLDHGPVVSKSNIHQLATYSQNTTAKELRQASKGKALYSSQGSMQTNSDQGVSFKSCLEGNAEGKMPAISTSVTALSIMTVHALIDIQPAKNVI